MRIISKFHDYYDSCIGYGIDPKLIYVRKTQEEIYNLKDKMPRELKSALGRASVALAIPRPEIGCDVGIIAFCGEITPFWQIATTEGPFCYSVKDVVKAIRKAGDVNIDKERAIGEITGKPTTDRRKYRLFSRYSLNSLTPESWKRYRTETGFKIGAEPHRVLEAPVFAMIKRADGLHLIRNPLLRTMDFARIVDPYTAFQKLSMFLGNEMAQQKDPIIDIPDELKAESHGFNKWSFRKPPKK